MHKQQHYKLTNVKKVKSQSTTPFKSFNKSVQVYCHKMNISENLFMINKDIPLENIGQHLMLTTRNRVNGEKWSFYDSRLEGSGWLGDVSQTEKLLWRHRNLLKSDERFFLLCNNVRLEQKKSYLKYLEKSLNI